MGKRYGQLFERIVDPDNLWTAYRRAARGKRRTVGYLQFRDEDAAHLVRLKEALAAGTYRAGVARHFKVFEPKPREIVALPFVDRVVQHALCAVIEPIFERVFLPQSFACRPGRGTHRAAIAVQSHLRTALRAGSSPWVLKTDFSKYFASVDRATLWREFARKISCDRTLALLGCFIEPDGRGLPIGNLASQLGANLYGHILDRWLVHQVGLTRFVRYMDDVVVIGHSREALALLQVQMGSFAAHEMRLGFSRWSIQPWQRGVNFCGYRIWPTHKLLRRSSVVRAKQRLRGFERSGDYVAQAQFLSAWRGHAGWADARNLMVHMGVSNA